MSDILDEILNFESTDPVEKAKILSRDQEFMKQFELEQKNAELRRYMTVLENHGIYLRSKELPRTEYLKRLANVEQDNLCSLLEHIWLKTSRDVSAGIIAVGTTTYAQKDWDYLKKLTTLPNAKYVEYEVDYSDQTEWIPKKEFDLKEIINRQGEDIDIKFCPYSDYDSKKMSLISEEIKNYALKHKLPLIKYTEKNIASTDYHTEPPLGLLKKDEPVIVQRVKRLSELHTDALTIKFSQGRPIHCYFEKQPMHEKIDWERSGGYNFSIILHNNIDIQELKEVINNGRNTGIYEHPVILAYEKTMSQKNKKK